MPLKFAGLPGIVVHTSAALATVVGVLIEVPLMLWLVRICLRTTHWFDRREDGAHAR